jgi:hypothetical protein
MKTLQESWNPDVSTIAIVDLFAPPTTGRRH